MTYRRDRAGLMAGVSAVVLGIMVLAPSSARAFDDVNWTWEARVNETVDKTVTITIDLDPSGLVMLEDLQISAGDVTATSTVGGIHNEQPGGGSSGGSVTIDLGDVGLTGQYNGDDGTFPPTMQAAGSVLGPLVVLGGNVGAGEDGPPDDSVTAQIDLGTIEVEVPDGPGDPLDAITELPEVVSEATAVANNTTITADTAIQLHEAQWAVSDPVVALEAAEDWSALLNATPAEVSATSSVYDILNASVDSAATAVANNLAIDASAATDDDRVLIADVLQVSVANVTAVSSVNDVTVGNYTNLGAIDRPLVSSVATAVGNNKSISVGGGDDGE